MVLEERTIKVRIDTARKWYKGKSMPLKELALQAFSKEELEKAELPTSWSEYSWEAEYEEIAKNYCKFSKQIKTLNRLLVLRDIYRQGWKPDWTDNSAKYTIEYHYNYITTDTAVNCSCGVFSFPTKELAEQFLENFREELEQLRELL